MSFFGSRPGRRLVAACLVAVASEAGAQDLERVQVSVEAAYLYQFTRFVEWPEAASGTPIVVCIVGRDPFGSALDQTVQDKRAGGRPVTLRRLARAEDAASCSIAFLPSAEASRLVALRESVGRAPVLLVGDAPGFAREGGMIGFYREADRVRFEVNVDAAEAVGLRISSRLLGVARLVPQGGSAR